MKLGCKGNEKENDMRLLGIAEIVAGLAGAMALGSMTASQARFRAGPAIAAGVAGLALGAAAANASGYYGYGYGPGYGYDSYAYAPGYSGYGYSYEPSYSGYGYDSYAYSPGYRFEGAYNSNNNGPWHERQLQGRDW
jgi:hypothetical protein